MEHSSNGQETTDLENSLNVRVELDLNKINNSQSYKITEKIPCTLMVQE